MQHLISLTFSILGNINSYESTYQGKRVLGAKKIKCHVPEFNLIFGVYNLFCY